MSHTNQQQSETGLAIGSTLDLQEMPAGGLYLLCSSPGSGKSPMLTRCLADAPAGGKVLRVDGDYIAATNINLGQAITAKFLEISQHHSGDDVLEYEGTVVEQLQRFDLVVIAVENYHSIENAVNNALLEQLFALTNTVVHVVVSTCRRPALPLSNLRQQGRLFEIAWDAMVMSAEAISSFLLAQGLPCTQTDIDLLLYKTAGWPAGVQLLASLAKQAPAKTGALIESFSGSIVEVAEYFESRVFSQLDADLQRFCLLSSLLSRFNRRICREVFEDIDVDRHIDFLLNNNIFLRASPNAESGHPTSYVYDPLFQEFLRHRFYQSSDNAEAGPVFRSAALANREQGWQEDAAHYFLQAGDFEQAAQDVESCAMALIHQGQMLELMTLMEQFDEQLLLSRPRLAMINGWLCFHFRNLLLGERLVNSLARIEQNSAEYAVLKVGMLLIADKLDEMASYCPAQISRMRDKDQFLAGTVGNIWGCALLSIGSYSAAHKQADDALQLHTKSKSPYGKVVARVARAYCDIEMGRFSSAEVELQLAEVVAAGNTSDYCQALPELSKGVLYYHTGKLALAQQLLESNLPKLRGCGNFDMQYRSARTLAWLFAMQGNVLAALTTIENYIDEPSFIERAYGRWALNFEKMQIHLLANSHVEAEIYRDFLFAEEPPDHAVLRQRFWLAKAGLMLRENDPQRALALCQQVRSLNPGLLYLLRVDLIESLSFMAIGDTLNTQNSLARLLSHSGAHGGVVFKEQMQLAKPLLLEFGEAAREQLPKHLDNGVGLLFDWLNMHELGIAAPAAPVSILDTTSEPVEVIKHEFSAREIQILGLIAQGESNQVIAEQIYLSINTVKWHVRNVLQKLAVENRTKAVSRARALDLIA